MKTTIVLVIDHKKPIADLLKLVEGRVYNLDRVEDCNAFEAEAAEGLRWCSHCGEGVTTFCRGKDKANCPIGLREAGAQS